ncbi:hypothetical protein K0U83_02300 [bacterium]|nr:hypothetical protein [bacterium]
MPNLTFVSDPWGGHYPEFTHCRYIAHNGGLPTFLLTNEQQCQKYGYPPTRDIINGYLWHHGNVDEEEHKNEGGNWEGFTQVTFEFGPLEPINDGEE